MTATGGDLRESLRDLSDRTGRDPEALEREADACLAEMRADRSPFGVGAFAALSRFVCRRGYDPQIVSDEAEFERVAALAAAGPVVYLVTHKTYLDMFVLYHALHARGIRTPYVFGGINMDFFGLGALSRRAGGIFIRRRFRDDEVYKLALRDYVSGLLADGASFMWAIEGTRSRTGKLVMPKLGLLKYVVDASRRPGPEVVKYIPVSIGYDLIPDVEEMTAQQIGATKRPESFGWFLRYVRGLKQPLGRIYLRFGEPVSLHDTPDAPGLGHQGDAEESIAVQKLAFEVCYRINEVTPPTGVSLTLFALLCEQSVERSRLADNVDALMAYVGRHKPAATKRLAERPSHHLDAVLRMLAGAGLVQLAEDGRVTITPAKHLTALYYANMVAHHFVVAAFLELALLHTAEQASGAAFWPEIRRLRDLFKMEFFFARRDDYRRQVEGELAEHDERWRELLAAGGDTPMQILADRRFFVAPGVLLPIVEAGRVVARALRERIGGDAPRDAEFIEACLPLGRRMAEAGEIRWPDSASRALLAGAALLARNRGLFGKPDPERDRARQVLEQEFVDVARRLEVLVARADRYR